VTLVLGSRLSALGLLIASGCSGADARDPAARETVAVAPRRSPALAPDTARLTAAFDRARDLPRLRSLVVQWKGDIIRERYYGGATAATRANIKSASKSVVSALVGIAIAQGHLEGPEQTIAELLPADARRLDSAKRAITVGDLLSMRAGLQSTSFDNYGAWVTSRNWVAYALRQPMVSERGGPMIYSTGNSHLLSAILTRATRMSTFRFADRQLMRPLGVTLRPWQTDPQGIFFGGNDMFLTPRDMLKFGTLYLNGGVANGRQIVSRSWIDSSFVPRTTSPFNGNRYGYGWWTRSAQGYDVRYAWGYGGQFIFIVPELELVVVATSNAESPREGGHTWAIHRLLEDEIVPAFVAGNRE
jgi:CubicO group peptidase (beta-lactamase class C family)